MTFILSKIFWAMFTPAMLLLLLTLLAFLLLRRWPRLARGLLALAVAFQLAIYLTPLPDWVLRPLENRFPQPTPAQPVDGIIVLGGALDIAVSRDRGRPELNFAGDRLTALVALARQYPGAKLVFTSGSPKLLGDGYSEADYVPAFVQSLGLDPQRLMLEKRSRNTWENAVFSKQLVQPRTGEHWLLVTSAWHMPRAIGCFRAAGWPVTAYPVDYLSALSTPDQSFAPEWRMLKLELGLKEWAGLVAYRLMGRTPALFPAL
ncbi:MAG: YdcF family protein [Stenotrophobium sp.]